MERKKTGSGVVIKEPVISKAEQAKRQIRNFYKQKREQISAAQADMLSEKISAHILQWDMYHQAGSVFFYYPLGREVSLLSVVKDAFLQGKRVSFPKVSGTQMDFYEITDLSQLKEGSFHVMEPYKKDCMDVYPKKADALDGICFVPGMAFDAAGGRFGYGKGYYDRYFSKERRLVLVGCAYACQIAKQLPTDSWDQNMDYLATEHGLDDCVENKRTL